MSPELSGHKDSISGEQDPPDLESGAGAGGESAGAGPTS